MRDLDATDTGRIERGHNGGDILRRDAVPHGVHAVT